MPRSRPESAAVPPLPAFDLLWLGAGGEPSQRRVAEACREHADRRWRCRLRWLTDPDALLPALLDGGDVQAVVLQAPADAGTTALAEALRAARPEVELYLLTADDFDAVDRALYAAFDRVFADGDSLRNVIQTLLHALSQRQSAPFFEALAGYSRRPVGAFHALPLARGGSLQASPWMADFAGFFGDGILMAETSATQGGLDSLLQPTGPLREAQRLAARAYGAARTWFVTNGTSTANKIVVQALVQPGDLVLINRDCHKSHHYALVQAGANAVYLDGWRLPAHGLYGAVPIAHLVQTLQAIRTAGKLDRVRLVVLTHCTFDGLVYDAEAVMLAALAIKPDLVFLWDEAWFAFARFSPALRPRTAMEAARRLTDRFRSEAYRQQWQAHCATLADGELPRLPDPDRVQVRVWATQSTHKTMTSFRQGSMIHARDEDFDDNVAPEFHEAFMTHTSTSPSYPILASLDAGRRQAHLEGHARVATAIGHAARLRAEIAGRPLLRRWFRVLDLEDFQTPAGEGFALDPTKLTLDLSRTGISGAAFRRLLMEQYQIQVNKTATASVLLMTGIGTRDGDLLQLMDALMAIAEDLERSRRPLTVGATETAPLPDFSAFHSAFQPLPGVTAGDLRRAFYLGYDEVNYRHLPLPECLLRLAHGEELVASSFVTPYPPGFPVLVPGQRLTEAVVRCLIAAADGEIHGLDPQRGLRVFVPDALETGLRVSPLARSGERRPSLSA